MRIGVTRLALLRSGLSAREVRFHTVTGSATYGHRLGHIRLQARLHTVAGALRLRGVAA